MGGLPLKNLPMNIHPDIPTFRHPTERRSGSGGVARATRQRCLLQADAAQPIDPDQNGHHQTMSPRTPQEGAYGPDDDALISRVMVYAMITGRIRFFLSRQVPCVYEFGN